MAGSANVTGLDRLTAAELRDSRASWWSEQFTAALRRLLGPIDGVRILDLGCGTGILAEKLHSTRPSRAHVFGIDIDLGRLVRVSQAVNAAGASLPFRRASFSASVTILTLQHVPDPLPVLAEMGRVTRPDGIVLAVEADNRNQRLYLSTHDQEIEERYVTFWQAVAQANPGTHFQLGPRLLGLFDSAGFLDSRVEGFLATHARFIDPPLFFSNLRQRIQVLADRYKVGRTQESCALLTAISKAKESASRDPHFYSVSTIPLFLVTGRVRPAV